MTRFWLQSGTFFYLFSCTFWVNKKLMDLRGPASQRKRVQSLLDPRVWSQCRPHCSCWWRPSFIAYYLIITGLWKYHHSRQRVALHSVLNGERWRVTCGHHELCVSLIEELESLKRWCTSASLCFSCTHLKTHFFPRRCNLMPKCSRQHFQKQLVYLGQQCWKWVSNELRRQNKKHVFFPPKIVFQFFQLLSRAIIALERTEGERAGEGPGSHI